MPLPQVESAGQLATFFIAFIPGVILCLFYDLFRIRRRVWHAGVIAVFIQDILYFSVSAVVVYLFLLIRCSGSIRIYPLAGCLAGWILCRKTLSRPFFFGTTWLIIRVIRIYNLIKVRFINPFSVKTKIKISEIKAKFRKTRKNSEKNIKKSKKSKKKTCNRGKKMYNDKVNRNKVSNSSLGEYYGKG